LGKIIAVANQKGGVGKTTTSINLAAAIALFQQSVLLIDLDPQANTTSGLGCESPPSTIYDCLIRRTIDHASVQLTGVAGLCLVPSNSELVGAEIELAGLDEREKILQEALREISHQYHWIIIDCPPALGLLTINALVAASSVLIPVQCEYYAMEGLGRLIGSVDRVRESFNHGLELEGIVLTMFDSRVNLARQVKEEIQSYFQEKVFQTTIPRNISLAEAPSYGQPVILYNASSSGSKAYQNLAKEFLSHGKESAR